MSCSEARFLAPVWVTKPASALHQLGTLNVMVSTCQLISISSDNDIRDQ